LKQENKCRDNDNKDVIKCYLFKSIKDICVYYLHIKGELLKVRKILMLLSLAMGMIIMINPGYGYYAVGDTLSQDDLQILLVQCANGNGDANLGSLLKSSSGEPNRVLWLNLFASW